MSVEVDKRWMNALRFPANGCFCKIFKNFRKDDKTPNKHCLTSCKKNLVPAPSLQTTPTDTIWPAWHGFLIFFLNSLHAFRWQNCGEWQWQWQRWWSWWLRPSCDPRPLDVLSASRSCRTLPRSELFKTCYEFHSPKVVYFVSDSDYLNFNFLKDVTFFVSCPKRCPQEVTICHFKK